MPSTYSPSLRIELIGAGEQSGTWGTTTNTNLGTLLEQSIAGVQAITMFDANYTLTNYNGVSDEARKAVLVVSGTNNAIRDIIAPLVQKIYIITNNTVGGFAINIRAATGSSVSIPNGSTSIVYCDGVGFYLAIPRIVSVKDFGAVGDGVTNDTAAIQAALNNGSLNVYFPSGNYKFTSLVIPQTVGLCIYGDGGRASTLMQYGTGISWPAVVTATNFYGLQTIQDLAFDGTNGSGVTLNTSYVGNLEMLDLLFYNVPAGYSSIYLDGNVAQATDTHDMRIDGLRIYHNSGASAVSGITCGANLSDTAITNFIMQGNFHVNYCINMLAGANAISLSNSHIYNAAINILNLQGANNYCQFSNVTIDNSLSSIVNIVNSAHNIFTNCYIESVQSGQNGVNLVGSSDICFVNTLFFPVFPAGATSAVYADATSAAISIIGGSLSRSSGWSNVFNLLGTNCYAINIPGYSTLGLRYSFSGCTPVSQPQATTQYLGINGGQTTVNATAYVVPNTGNVTTVYIACASTPAAGQTFTFNVMRNVTQIGTATVSNGQFGATITLNAFIAANDLLSIQSVFSATSGSSNIRYVVNFTA